MASIVTRFAVAFVVASIVFAILTYNYDDFQWPVLMIFFFVLGVTHFALASEAFGPRSIKFMDFLYVVSGCLAAYIGLQDVKSEKLRYPYLVFLSEWKLASQERGLPMKARPRAIADYIKKQHGEYCAESFVKHPLHEDGLCRWADTSIDVLDKTPGARDVVNLYETTKSAAKKYAWDFTYICTVKKTDKNGLTTYSMQPDPVLQKLCVRNSFVSHVIEGLGILVKRNELSRPHTFEDSDKSELTFFGSLKALLWPILLAIALAFRLTKATADVTGLASSG